MSKTRPKEVDSPEVVRNGLIELRNRLLTDNDFDNAVLLSHAIVWLAYLIQIEHGS
jgi:hypothetical protein